MTKITQFSRLGKYKWLIKHITGCSALIVIKRIGIRRTY
jgi:hypothetical protein